jgi:hypothetical protein
MFNLSRWWNPNQEVRELPDYSDLFDGTYGERKCSYCRQQYHPGYDCDQIKNIMSDRLFNHFHPEGRKIWFITESIKTYPTVFLLIIAFLICILSR